MSDDGYKRSWPAIRNGIACRCPRCGKGRLFHRYIEQVSKCDHCGELMGYYKVGLFLPLIVITLMVHVIGFVMLEMELSGHGSPLVYLRPLTPKFVRICRRSSEKSVAHWQAATWTSFSSGNATMKTA